MTYNTYRVLKRREMTVMIDSGVYAYYIAIGVMNKLFAGRPTTMEV